MLVSSSCTNSKMQIYGVTLDNDYECIEKQLSQKEGIKRRSDNRLLIPLYGYQFILSYYLGGIVLKSSETMSKDDYIHILHRLESDYELPSPQIQGDKIFFDLYNGYQDWKLYSSHPNYHRMLGYTTDYEEGCLYKIDDLNYIFVGYHPYDKLVHIWFCQLEKMY